MIDMRISLQIDDDLVQQLRLRAKHEAVTISDLVSQLVRIGLDCSAFSQNQTAKLHHEQTFSMGQPRISLHDASALAARLEDGETRDKLIGGR